MMDNTASRSKTFQIIYGWAEGPWHGRKLTEALLDSGYREAKLEEANIIIAHSAGAYLIPKKAKAVLIIGLPYWPGKSVAIRCIQKVWYDFWTNKHRLFYWLFKASWNVFYFISQPRHNFRLSRASRYVDNFILPLHAVIVRNQNDAFCTPEIQDYFQNKVIELPGQHDDCWENPLPYLKTLQREEKVAA